MPSSLQFCTIVTYGRTGSTTLQSAANAQRGVVIRGENYGALRGMRSYLQSVAETASRHHAGKPDHPWFGSARLDPRAVRDRLREEIVASLLRPRAHTEWSGFKEIRYTSAHWPDYDTMLEYLLFLNTVLPDLRFLINIRSTEDAMHSAWWRTEPNASHILETTESWLREAHRDLQALLRPEQSVLVEYGQWSKDPDVITRAFSTLGLPADDNLVRTALSQKLSHGAST
jgi:hypothetical protein